MSPRPTPDLDLRRDQFIQAARTIAEADGWPAVTMRKLAADLGVTQPVLYSAFPSRQALVDAVALGGFSALADVLTAADSAARSRMRAYLGFAAEHPQVYEAMFSLPSGLPFASDATPAPMLAAFAGIREAFPDEDGTLAEVAWSTLHGLAVLEAGGRLRAGEAERRLALAHRALTGAGDR